jgi:hypothetical protein
MVYGPWGLGKSFMVLDMALTATKGDERNWFERKIERPLKTLYVVAEGAAWWYRRMQAFEQGRGPVDKNLFRVIPHPVDLFGDPNMGNTDLGNLEQSIAIFEPDIVVIDTWVRCTAAFGMQEDKATDTAKVMARLDTLRDEYNTSFIIVHHPTKSGDGFRGSGNQGASLEIILGLKPGPAGSDTFKVFPEKGNHMSPWPPFLLGFEEIEVAEDKFGEPITSAYLRYEGEADDKAATAAMSAAEWYDKQRDGMRFKSNALQAVVGKSTHKVLKVWEDDGMVENTGEKDAQSIIWRITKGGETDNY